MEKLTFLGNTFFRNAVSHWWEKVLGSRLPLGVSTSTKPVVLDKKFCALLVCDASFKKVASRELNISLSLSVSKSQALFIRSQDYLMRSQASLMRAWLARIMLAIFGLSRQATKLCLWLAVI